MQRVCRDCRSNRQCQWEVDLPFTVKHSPDGCLCNCRKDLEPGLHISRLGREDFAQFFRLARTMTAFVRIKQVTSALALLIQRN